MTEESKEKKLAEITEDMFKNIYRIDFSGFVKKIASVLESMPYTESPTELSNQQTRLDDLLKKGKIYIDFFTEFLKNKDRFTIQTFYDSVGIKLVYDTIDYSGNPRGKPEVRTHELDLIVSQENRQQKLASEESARATNATCIYGD